jgi:hypothetical protein
MGRSVLVGRCEGCGVFGLSRQSSLVERFLCNRGGMIFDSVGEMDDLYFWEVQEILNGGTDEIFDLKPILKELSNGMVLIQKVCLPYGLWYKET